MEEVFIIDRIHLIEGRAVDIQDEPPGCSRKSRVSVVESPERRRIRKMSGGCAIPWGKEVGVGRKFVVSAKAVARILYPTYLISLFPWKDRHRCYAIWDAFKSPQLAEDMVLPRG